MKEIQYKRFSWETHKTNWKLGHPNVCQFELTFGCDLRCKYCYTDCYNTTEYRKRELKTRDIKFIIDEIYNLGVIWVCFTGGDPVTRPDFLEIYAYAKEKGFIITVFTNGYSMTKEIVSYFEKRPPFVIEITLNAVSKVLYEEISGIEDSFEKTMEGIGLILDRGLSLKIKTQVIKDNLQELPKLKEFIERLGLQFRPTVFLHARLNGDLTPASLRVMPKDIMRLDGRTNLELEVGCGFQGNGGNNNLFNCAIGGGDGIHIDPCGNLIPCLCIRDPKMNLLKEGIRKANKTILGWVRSETFTNNSKCKTCSIRASCYSCPGKALLEKKDLEAPVEWFCGMAQYTRTDYV